MTKKLEASGPYSLYYWADNLIFISGQLPINPDTGDLVTGFKNQCKRSLLNIQKILENQNLLLNDIVKLTVLVDDLEYFNEVNEVFKEFFNEPYPSRSTFETARLPKDSLIEIEAIALKKK